MVHFRSRGIGLEQCIQLMKNSRNGTIWFHGEREKNTKLFFYHYLKENIKKIDAINGQIIIMDCKSGEIKAMVNLMNTKSGIKSAIRQLSEPTALMRTVSLLAALEQGKVKPNDSIDTKAGMLDINGYLLKDHNWLRGGNGKTSVQQGFLLSSNIATYLAVKQAFGKEYDRFYKAITNMGYGLPQITFTNTYIL